MDNLTKVSDTEFSYTEAPIAVNIPDKIAERKLCFSQIEELTTRLTTLDNIIAQGASIGVQTAVDFQATQPLTVTLAPAGLSNAVQPAPLTP